MTLFETTNVANHDCLLASHLPFPRYQGKVRDCYDLGQQLLLVSTDRISAFDRILGVIPFKGQALTQLSAWWFEQTKSIIDNHFIKLTTANSMLVRKCTPLPIEVIARGYITGTTQTSLWTLYQQGQREFFGKQLPDSLSKNQKLPQPILTPTTKEKDHDQPLAIDDLDKLDFITTQEWQQIADSALQLFTFASNHLAKKGILLADTKYEFGRDQQGNIILIDELHTSDSSRYWDADTYQQRLADKLEPESFDKEILRLWYKQHCDPYHDQQLPEPPLELIEVVSLRYQQLYQLITGKELRKEPSSCVASLASLPITP